MIAFVLLGCSWLTNSGAVDGYSQQVRVAMVRVVTLESSLSDSDARLSQLEEVIRLQGQNDAERLETMDQVNREISRLRGELEVVRFELDNLKEVLQGDELDRERRMLHGELRLEQLERFLGVESPPAPSDAELGLLEEPAEAVDEAAEGAISGEETGALPPEAQGKLDLAIEHMRSGRQAVARAILEKAIDDHAGATELAEIRYRVAETWFNEANWPKAIKSFQAVVDNHAQADWAAWSVLRQGESFEKMGEPAKAKVFYKHLIKTYPRSDAAKEGKQLVGN